VHAFAGEIVKFERTDEGDLVVFGKATGPDLDLDEQVCDPGWLKSAMPDWARWSNLRAMHGPVAAGVGIETSQSGEDWFVKSLITDRESAHKVETGTYKGYSIGIRNARVVKDADAPGGRIVGGTIVELSLVDRPCNPTATVAIAKAAKGSSELAPVEAEPESGEPAEAGDLAKAAMVDDPQGAEPTAPAFDRELALAVAGKAAVRDRAGAIALLPQDAIKAVAPDGLQDEAPDIAGGKAVMRLLGQLICNEAEELAAGYLDEACDIRILLQAVSAVTCWLQNEQAAADDPDEPYDFDEDGAPIVYIGLDVEADLFKSFTAAQRRAYAKSGVAMPNGDFPIPDRDHLRSAVGRLGNYTGDKAKAKAHLIARAKALGATNLLPDDWAGGSDTAKGASGGPSGVAGAIGAATATRPAPTPDSGGDDIKNMPGGPGDGAQAIADAAQADRDKAARKAARKKAKKMSGGAQPNAEAVTTAATAAKAAGTSPVDPTGATIGDQSGTDLVKMVADLSKSVTALTETKREQEERIEALSTQLKTVLDTPIPGGPVLIAPDTAPSREPETLTKAAYYRSVAQQTGDPSIRRAYMALAEETAGSSS
jgi:cell division septum initiation protein DivIVA